MKIYKIAKHVSDHSHSCIYCKSFLKPSHFSRNKRHHFPWGINYDCGCGKSGIWTNSIRGEQEFLDVVYKNSPIRNNFTEKGFCNDLFCPVCFSFFGVIKNGLGMSTLDKPATYVSEDKKDYYITNYELYMVKYNKNPDSVRKHDPECMGKEAHDIIKYVDILGCRSLKHDLGVISHGYS